MLMHASPHALRPILMQTSPRVRTHLHSQDAKDDEEGAADEDDIPDGPQRGDERLHDQL